MVSGSRKKSCPICSVKEPVADYHPFCSKRCADVDLSRWLGGKYAIPSSEPVDEFELMDAIERERKNAPGAEE